MTFDGKEYSRRVLSQYAKSKEPILRKALRELKQDPQLKLPSEFDLAEFYDISVEPNDVELASHIDAVASCISHWVRQPGRPKQPLDFHALIIARNPNLKSADFWPDVLQRRTQRAQAALNEFGANIATDFSALGVVTRKQLRDLAKGSGIPESISDSKLAEVVKAAGVSVVDEFPVVNPAPPAQVLNEITNGIKKTSAKSVLSAIFLEKGGEPDTFSILDGFLTSDNGYSLSIETVKSAYSYSQHRPDTDENDSFRKILAAIMKSATSDAELVNIVIAYFIDLGRQTFKEVVSKRGALTTFIERTGLAKEDAGRILLHVAPDGFAQKRGWPDVQALIRDGNLKEARRLYEAVFAELGESTSTEQEKALQDLLSTETKVEELRRKAQTAQTQGDLEIAMKALSEALTLCGDDESLSAAALCLPPAAPIRFASSLSEDARIVKLSWEPGFGSTDDVRYQVIRKIGSLPQNNNDGALVGNDIQATSFEDSSPPIAVKVYYGVSASRGGGASPVAVTEVMALPPVSDVVVTSDPKSITLRWTMPPEASTIEIVQTAPDGLTMLLQVDGQSGTTSSGLRMGATYTYLLTAIYFGTSGERLKSATVRATGVPRGSPKPVPAITITDKTSVGMKPEVAVEWAPIKGYAVEIWHYAQKPSWLIGTRLAMSEIRTKGRQLAGRSITNGGCEGVQGTSDQGLRYYVAITRDGEFGLVGAMVAYGSAPPVQNLHAVRLNDEVVLSWDWPGPEYEVRVRWNGASSGERIIAMSKYRTEGGCRVLLGSGGGTFEVASVAGEGDTRWVSSVTTLEVHGEATVVEYDIYFRKKLFCLPSGATLKFSMLTSAMPIDVVVVACLSKWMPSDPLQGSVLKRATVSITSPQIEVTLPRGAKGPIWVRAFASTCGVRLIDPPPTRMKVK